MIFVYYFFFFYFTSMHDTVYYFLRVLTEIVISENSDQKLSLTDYLLMP